MNVLKLADGASSAGVQVTLKRVGNTDESVTAAIVQAVITDTATVALEGSLDGTNWFPITSFSSSDLVEMSVPVWVRGNVTSYSAGTVTLSAQLPGRWSTV